MNFPPSLLRLIKLSSPNLNYLIIAGALIFYIDIYVRVVPTTSEEATKVICLLTPWLTAIGYSLSYGTIVAKMVRVYIIFNNPKPNSTNVRAHRVTGSEKFTCIFLVSFQTMKDWKLAVGVLVLVVIDLTILITFTVIEGLNGVETITTLNKENPSRSDEVR